MSSASLTAKYRPQTFAQVAGQDTVKAILSRASLEQRVAPAYLFSGTRGVGKTTLARIFAKALNCRTAPTAEPCNQCDQCRAITAGNAVDVVEIDGASNRGIDDVRRLKEVVGYAPMEGGYKIFIIDEAHMLSREAFNALLKTLEEPPARVTFIMATTEPHKFPATIISRCQHYVFKPLSETGLVDHLAAILQREGVEFEENAVRLIARRGAGSVRDSMSLLGQVLALGDGKLTQSVARNVLGLAGQEAFLQLLEGFRNSDGLGVSRILREMLDLGLDMGFFLRELSSLWRNLFMLRQSGEAALSVVDIPADEALQYLEISKGFSLQHIHACWQMTLEGQRRVLTSLEPALGLELLLLNIAMLPNLLSLEQASVMGRKAARSAEPSGSGGGRTGPAGDTAPGGPASGTHGRGGGSGEPGRTFSGREEKVTSLPVPGEEERRQSAPPAVEKEPSIAKPPEKSSGPEPDFQSDPEDADEAAIQEAMSELAPQESAPETELSSAFADPAGEIPKSIAENAEAPLSGMPFTEEREKDQREAVPAANSKPLSHPEWSSFFDSREDMPSWLGSLLRRATGVWRDDILVLTFEDSFAATRLESEQVRAQLDPLFRSWCGAMPLLEVAVKQKQRKSYDELKAEVMDHPLVKEVQAQLGAYFLDCGQIR